jgi:hypothetical protein
MTTRSFLCLLLAVLSAAAGAQEPGPGSICIAPFKIPVSAPGEPPTISEPPMSTTPAPSASSKFTFRIDRELKATVGNGEMALITGVPVDRKVLVEIRMDGRPFESFRLDLGKQPEKRVCLWLYPGYWHWINNGWQAKLGCQCKAGAS